MNTAAMAHNLYARPAREVDSKRGIEYKAFSKITARLAALAHEDTGFPEVAEALCENLMLWTTLGADVANEGNQFPAELRAQIFYLTEFTNHHTSKVMKGEATSEILVEINTSIMRGLRHSAPAAPTAVLS